MTEAGTTWTGPWTAERPVEIGFAWAPRDEGTWKDGGDGLERRDLGLDAASDGALGVTHLRVADLDAVDRPRAHHVDFDALYVLRGAVTLESDDAGSVRLERGGCAVQPPRTPHRLRDVTPDFEAVHITAPARFGTTVDPPARTGGHYTHDTPDAYARGAGPRSFFLYRDLGTRAVTGDRIHLHVVRATEPGEGTGWHFHTMAQWFMVLEGSAEIGVEDHPTRPLRAGDAMCLGRGPRMRHDVASFSGDYTVLEMCVPAEYDTIAVDRPEGATLGS